MAVWAFLHILESFTKYNLSYLHWQKEMYAL